MIRPSQMIRLFENEPFLTVVDSGLVLDTNSCFLTWKIRTFFGSVHDKFRPNWELTCFNFQALHSLFCLRFWFAEKLSLSVRWQKLRLAEYWAKTERALLKYAINTGAGRDFSSFSLVAIWLIWINTLLQLEILKCIESAKNHKSAIFRVD